MSTDVVVSCVGVSGKFQIWMLAEIPGISSTRSSDAQVLFYLPSSQNRKADTKYAVSDGWIDSCYVSRKKCAQSRSAQ